MTNGRMQVLSVAAVVAALCLTASAPGVRAERRVLSGLPALRGGRGARDSGEPGRRYEVAGPTDAAVEGQGSPLLGANERLVLGPQAVHGRGRGRRRHRDSKWGSKMGLTIAATRTGIPRNCHVPIG